MQPKDHLKLINSSTASNLHLYQIISRNEYVCTIKDYNLLQSSEIIDLIKPFIRNCDDVLTIQTKPLTEYQTASLETKPWVIRKLTTSTQSENLKDFNFSKLEQPNILSGVAAGGNKNYKTLFI